MTDIDTLEQENRQLHARIRRMEREAGGAGSLVVETQATAEDLAVALATVSRDLAEARARLGWLQEHAVFLVTTVTHGGEWAQPEDCDLIEWIDEKRKGGAA